MNVALQVDSLSITTSDSQSVIVHPLSFEIPAGTAVNLVGETGSGKSLIAQAILGNLATSLSATGNIYIDKVEYLNQPEQQRRKLWGKRLSLLPQEPWLSLNPTRKSLGQLSEVYQHVVGNTKNTARQSANAALERFDIQESKDKFPHQLSGGMAQRLVFCCTMAGGAEILIVDEPTKGLDTERKQEVIQQLQDFLKAGGYLLVITHDVEVAEQLEGQTIVLKNGWIQERNQTATLFTSPAKDYTKALINASPNKWSPISKVVNEQPVLIHCTGISKSFNKKTLFENVDLDIHRGEIVGLYGQSGSGKSTLGDILLHLIKPDSGEVSRDPGFKSFQYLKLYQDPPAAFSSFHTMKSSMDDFMALHRLEQNRFDNLLTQLNLDHSLLARTPGNISGGELQRLAIMRTLLLDPVFLFADEPTSRLDPLTQKETMQLMCSTVENTGCSMLLVSHDIELLHKCCHRVIEMSKWKQ